MGVVQVHPTEGSSPDEPDPDDADTGPLQVSESTHSDDGWRPAPDTWAARFDAPLTVNPRRPSSDAAEPSTANQPTASMPAYPVHSGTDTFGVTSSRNG